MSKEKLFSFNTSDFPNYNLEVVNFRGHQEIGELFRYEIDLISKESDIDFDKILQSEVSLQIHEKNGEDVFIHGVLEYFEAHQQIDNFIYYKASLVPKLWWLTLAEHQEIFLDKSVPDIIESVLKEANFTSSDYEFRMQGSYEKREYVCQYKESRYDFIKRWMHRDGIYFYFESDQNSCKLIVTDSKDTQKKSSQEIPYKPTSGLQDYDNQVASSIVYRSNNTLQSVHMRNYNYEKPSLQINTSTDTPYEKYKETYLFGNNLKSQAEAKKLSEILAQKYKSLDKEVIGESNIKSLSVGNIFTLKEYFNKDLNGEYLMVKVESEGSQRGFLTTAFRDESDESSHYTNTFTMIPAITQFRMQKTSPWPHISGVISAIIDGQGSGDTAELDKHGRYKVRMPFDLSGRGNAKASAYLRMAQPSAGEKQGIHFPLHKGTEVLVAFKGGDPDQPVITGAVPNINSPSPVNEDNVTKSVIQTHGGNIIHMEDTPGKAHIKMAVHDDLSSITIHNEDDEENEEDKWGIALVSKGGFKLLSAEAAIDILGEKFEMFVGAVQSLSLAETFALYVGANQQIGLSDIRKFIKGTEKNISPAANAMHAKINKIAKVHNHITNENTYVTDKSTKIVDNSTHITNKITEVVSETRIAEIAKQIMSSESFTQCIASHTLQAETVTKMITEQTKSVVTKTDKITTHLQNLETKLKVIGTEMTKAEMSVKKSNLRTLVSNLATFDTMVVIE